MKLVGAGICKSWGATHVLRGVDFTCEPGTLTALTGANGAGKTTLIRILATILRPDAGKITLGELDLAAKALKVNALATGFRGAARRAGHPLNQGFAGYSDFAPGRYDASRFATYLAAPGPRHLVMCHPGRVDDALRRLDPVTEAREGELAFLLSAEFVELLAQKGARLGRYAAWLTRP